MRVSKRFHSRPFPKFVCWAKRVSSWLKMVWVRLLSLTNTTSWLIQAPSHLCKLLMISAGCVVNEGSTHQSHDFLLETFSIITHSKPLHFAAPHTQLQAFCEHLWYAQCAKHEHQQTFLTEWDCYSCLWLKTNNCGWIIAPASPNHREGVGCLDFAARLSGLESWLYCWLCNGGQSCHFSEP